MIIFLIFQICSACQIEDLSICLKEIGDEIQNIQISNQNGFAYGFWSQYGSMNYLYDKNYQVFNYTHQGYTLLREINPLTNQVLLTYYQKWEHRDTSPNKYLIIQGNNYISEFSFESYSYEGKWIYHYFGFFFPDTLQIIIYDFQNCILQNLNYPRQYQESIMINQGGQYKLNDIQLAYFIGRLSILDIEEQPILFSTQQQFIQYLSVLGQPTPYCKVEVFQTSKIQTYKYQTGLILIESWVQIAYIPSLNASVSIFGVDFVLESYYQQHQKLIDLMYFAVFGWDQNTINGVLFQGYERTESDYLMQPTEFFMPPPITFKEIKSDLKKWHFVQIFYGFQGDQSIQKLKMWFTEGITYDQDLGQKIYSLYERNLIIRAGSLFASTQNGFSVRAGLSKIYVCLPTISEFVKQCYHGCTECEGPSSTDCLSCNLNSNRHYDNRQCKCNFGYVEDNSGKCMKFIDLYPNSQQFYVPINQNLYQYGLFPIVHQSVMYYLECPKYNYKSEGIYCIECLSNPETFAQSLACRTDYWLTAYGQYQIKIRESRDIELYSIDYELMQIRLCQGCSKFCDPNIDEKCFRSNSFGRDISCLDGYFHQLGECRQCADECSKCESLLQCLECRNKTKVLNPQNGTCISCIKNCLKCTFDEENKLTCLQCAKKYSLDLGECIPCGINCQTCIYTLDTLTNSYYNRCIECLDNKQYYLTLNAVDCAVNSISNCQYVIQFHKSWYLRMYDNTMFHLFKKSMDSSNVIFTYCALCDDGYASTMHGECVLISSLSATTTCQIMYEFEDWQQGILNQYTYYCQMVSERQSNAVTSIKNGCWRYQENCFTCFEMMCIECFRGYYVNLQNGLCIPCPEEYSCQRCEQQSKIFKNGWKVWYKMIYALIKKGSFYTDVFGDEENDKLEVICTKCDPGLEVYNGKCILSCAPNCKTCTIFDDQNYCVECNSYEGKPLSLFEGQCIECPRYCSLCHPKTSQQLLTINPYFTNVNVISSTHTCLLLEGNLNKEEFIYNSNFKQFFKYNAITNDPNKVILEFKLYCDLDLFEQDLNQSPNKQLFLSQNVKLNEILSSTASQSNFNRIENQYLYEYFGNQQIQQVEFQFLLLQDCTVSENSFLFTTLTQNIYFLNKAAITIQGNQKKLIMEQSLDIQGFDQISFNDINIIVAGVDRHINLQSLNMLDAMFTEVTITSQIKSNFYLQLTNIALVSIQGLAFKNVHLQNMNSFFKLQSPKDRMYFSISHINIIDSIFQETNLFLFEGKNEQINIGINYITISDSSFINSTIMATSQNEVSLSASFSDITIRSSEFIYSYPIFMTYFIQTFQLSRVQMLESSLQHSTLFEINQEALCQNIAILDSKIFNSSIFSQNINSAQPKSVNFYNLFFSNIIYDQQYSLIYMSSSLSDSQITIKNISLINLLLSQNTVLNAYSVFPLLFLKADFITLQQITIKRQKGMTEFSLSQATKLIIQDAIIENGNFFPSLITNRQCQSDISFNQYQMVFHIEKSQFIQLQNISIYNLTIFDVPLISIASTETQTVRRLESIFVDNFIMSDCIIQKTQSENSISMLHISSEQQISISLLNSKFTNNLYHSHEIESESDSALIMNLIVKNSDIIINNCNFMNNYLSQSQNSLMKLIASTIIISDTFFHSNNYFTSALLKHISWGFMENKLNLIQLSKYFAVISNSGNGRLQTNNLQISNTTITEGVATQAGCFLIILQNTGILTLRDSSFSKISSLTKGGCFYIDDKAKSIDIVFRNSLFDTISSISEGGSIYFQPTSQTILLNFINITIINSQSLIGAFINLIFSVYDTQILNMTDCKIIQTVDEYAKFVSSLENIDQVQKSLLQSGTSVIVAQQGQLVFTNIVIQLFITGFLETTYSSRISLTSVTVDHSQYGSRPAIMISCSQDAKCKVDINDIQMQGFSFYKNTTIFRYEVYQLLNEPIILESQCMSQIELVNPITYIQQVDLSNLENNIDSLILINQIKASDQISLKKSQFLKNQCLRCQNGIIKLFFSEQISKGADCQLQNVNILNNDCGISGCLSLFLGLKNSKGKRILSEGQNQIIINQLLCSKNRAVNGGCIYSEGVGLSISNSIINQNSAAKLGGGLYYSGVAENVILQDNLITSNTANSGGALYFDLNSSPELNRTKNYIASQSNLVSSYPTSLTITLDNYKNIQLNYHTPQYMGYIANQEKPLTQTILKLPSGQELSTYKYFNLKHQEYHPLNLTFRIVPLNNFMERQKNLTSSVCTIQSGYQQSDTIVMTNSQTSYYSKVFDNVTLDYNFDDLILYKNNATGYIILLFECNSVKIPIYDQLFPYQITNYIDNYTLQLTIQLYECQLGEYKNITDQSCHLCEVEKKQYSVQQGATSCQYMDDDTTMSITPAQLQLKIGYWRPFIDNGIVERCKNKEDNCLGGWKQGDEICFQGQLGACCESCDYYNVRGQGYFSKKELYKCSQCQDQQNQILYIIAISIWMLISIHLTTKGTENMILELQKNKVGRRQLIINSNKLTGPLIKMFTNYLQNIAIILNFNVNIPNALKQYFVFFGNSQQMLLISSDCFLAQSIQENIIYLKIIQCFLNPLIYGALYALLYMIMVSFNIVQYNKVVITTLMLYLFCYFQPQAMQLLITTLSYQTLSGIKWIQANLAYQFDQPQHLQWIPYLIVLTTLVGAVVPVTLLMKIYFHKQRLYIHHLRQNWGYLFLEYQPKAYFWEFIRIFTRQFMILAITFYQDNIILKCVLVSAIILWYSEFNNWIKPFQTSRLNQLETLNSVISIITIMCIFTLTATSSLYNIIIALIIFPNALLFLQFIMSLFSSYLQAYEGTLNTIKDTLRNKFPKLIITPIFKDLLVNKEERRKLIQKRFNSIKKYLFSVSSMINTEQKSINLTVPQIMFSMINENNPQENQRFVFSEPE